MKAALRLPIALAAVLALLLVATPAAAHDTHTAMNLLCQDPSPNTPSSYSDNECSGTFEYRVDWLYVELPVDAALNEDEDGQSPAPNDGDDPDDGQAVGQAIVATDFWIDGCGDNNDGGTYDIKWEDTWTSYTVPNGWTKVAEYKTTVSLNNIPTHVIQNDSTGQYRLDTDMPASLVCSNATTDLTLKTYSHENNNSNSEWVGSNPSSTGDYTVKWTAKDTGGTNHSDTDTITIS